MSINPSVAVDTVNKTHMPVSNGDTLYVGGSGPDNYTKIQDAIDNASDGDTVFVYAYSSPYYESIEIDKTINLIGENKDTTIINGSGTGDVVSVDADWVNVSGFTVQNSGANWGDAGIEILSNNTNICDNIINFNRDGIFLWYVNKNTIKDNIISDNGKSIMLWSSNRNTIVYNTFFDAGFYFHYSYHNIVYSNMINDKPLIYLENAYDRILESNAGQIILIRCDNITVQHQEITNTNICIELLETRNCIIANNTFSLNKVLAIDMIDSYKNIITDNNIFDNKAGISLHHSHKNNITNNSISKNYQGIKLTYYSDQNIIKSNNILDNKFGIQLDYSDSNSITKNNFINHIKNAYFQTPYKFSTNTWLLNYWRRPRSLPKLIIGMRWISFGQYGDHLIPWVMFDWHPAKEPYDIEVGIV